MTGALLAASLLLAPPAAPAQPQAEPPHVVLVFEDNTARPARPEELRGSLDGVRHAWTWTAESPPRTLAPTEVGHVAEPSPARERLSVRVAGVDPTEVPGIAVLAAPPEMWQEVPEELLPRFTVGEGGTASIPVDDRPWRLRLIGSAHGSGWIEVAAGQRTVLAAPVPARPLELRLLDPEGLPVAGARLSVTGPHPERGALRKFADYRSDDGGVALLPAMPPDLELFLVAAHDGYVPLTVSGRAGEIPPILRLEPGTALSGSLTDPRRRPVVGAEVTVRFWASDRLPVAFTRRATSDRDGRWAVEAVPEGGIELIVEAPGYAMLSERIQIPSEADRLAALVLQPAVPLAVRVRDDLDRPVAEAEVRSATAPAAATDPQGTAVLTVAPDRPVQLRISARGHLPVEKALAPPLPPSFDVTLTRAFRVEGTLLGGEGTPVTSGTVRSRVGRSFQTRELSAGGRFDLELPPSERVELTLLSPTTRQLDLDLEPGLAGEVRDLGDLAAVAGWTVTGRLLREPDGSAVAGARVWTVRASEAGPVMAWFLRDLLETRSDEEGRFTLAGLPRLPTTVRIEAAALAFRRIAVQPGKDEAPTDLGDVYLDAGSEVTVLADGAPEDARAELDLGLRNLPMDLRTTALVEGSATFRNVAAGPVRVAVAAGERVLCEETVTVEDGGEPVEVECTARPLTVSGTVSMGERPWGPGRLVWNPVAGEASVVPEAVMTFRSGGIQQLQVFTALRPPVTVAVGADGQFLTEDLRPGGWEVRWMPEEGSWPEPRRVSIPDAAEHRVLLRYDGFTLGGRVVDTGGEPVAGAHVGDRVSRSFALSADDGGFLLSVPEAGLHVLQARLRGETSPAVEVELEDGREPDPVLLVLGEERPEKELEVAVFADDDRPAAGALVFLESTAGELRILTADAEGRARTSLLAPRPSGWRAAAVYSGRWAFGAWTSAPPSEATRLELRVGATGGLVVTTEESSGTVVIQTPAAWKLTTLLRWLGSPPVVAPARPLHLVGLPPGGYAVTVDGQTSSVTVEKGEVAQAELP